MKARASETSLSPASRARAALDALSPSLSRIRSRLDAYRPPLREARFWATQALVVAIAGVHDSVEGFGVLPGFGVLYFVPISLFFIPVVYAALNFGFSGSVATALWCTVLVIPNWTVWHTGQERYGVMLQMGIINAVAVFVGSRVDQEMRARSEAETVSRALQVSETKYRSLFENSGEGVLVLDRDGRIVESNRAAARLFRMYTGEIRGKLANAVLPRSVAQTLSAVVNSPDGTPADIYLRHRDGAEIWVETVCTPLSEDEGATQVVLRDVTERKRRQLGLESYAAQTIRAQEEERQRIAQELHDDTVQSLILLCRKLDAIGQDHMSPSDPQVKQLRESRSYAESIAHSVRGFIHGLRPPVLDDLGLIPAIRRLVTDLSSRSPIAGEWTVAGRSRRLPPDMELTLFRIAQEALSNVERHSGASQVEVALSFARKRTRLTVTDDGVGFSVPESLNQLAADNMLGLMGMRERARAFGGELSIESAPSRGTKVVVELPTARAERSN